MQQQIRLHGRGKNQLGLLFLRAAAQDQFLIANSAISGAT